MTLRRKLLTNSKIVLYCNDSDQEVRMGGLGIIKEVFMYHYVEDKVFLKKMRRVCSDIINRLVQAINRDEYLQVEANLVGSGARNLITQNGEEPIDLDYNLCICKAPDIRDGRKIKEYIRKKFNEVLRKNNWNDCEDSTLALTTEKRHLKGNQTKFSIDIGIVYVNQAGWHRLKHEKTGISKNDRYNWVQAPNSSRLLQKVQWIKRNNGWSMVRDTYLKKKNMYLQRNDHSHHSFNVYLETINEVYNSMQKKE